MIFRNSLLTGYYKFRSFSVVKDHAKLLNVYHFQITIWNRIYYVSLLNSVIVRRFLEVLNLVFYILKPSLSKESATIQTYRDKLNKETKCVQQKSTTQHSNICPDSAIRWRDMCWLWHMNNSNNAVGHS